MPTHEQYKMYSQAVQDASFDLEFLNDEYQRLIGHRPLSFREDFCGAGYLSSEWVKQSDKHTAIGIDLCEDALRYGQEYYRAALTQEQQARLHYLKQDVLLSDGIHSDIIVAFNFSYWIFKTRETLRQYFISVRKSMNKDSIFFLDTKGGTEVVMVGTEDKKFREFTYYWECESYNPINRECTFSIHFKPKGKPKQYRAFTYHWRYWSIPEIRELLAEAGFSQSIVYMEGEDENDEGDGNFEPIEEDEDSAIWVAYIAALP